MDCDVCLGFGGAVNVEGRMPPVPFTVRVCVAELDVPCAKFTYESTDEVDGDPPPGASRPHWNRLATIPLELGDVEPRDLDGEQVTVTIEGQNETKTRTAEFDYYSGDECCGDTSFADLQFRFPR